MIARATNLRTGVPLKSLDVVNREVLRHQVRSPGATEERPHAAARLHHEPGLPDRQVPVAPEVRRICGLLKLPVVPSQHLTQVRDQWAAPAHGEDFVVWRDVLAHHNAGLCCDLVYCE